MKTFQKISQSILIFSILLSSYPVNITYAVDYQNISNFTPPNRAIIEYKDGVPGLDYPSFNNFTNNPNIPGAFNKDERQFIVGKNCGQSTTDCESKAYYNTLDQGIKEGDTVRFALYFHNNGGDPYVKETSVKSIQDATNVKIGVIFDKQDPNPQFAQDWLRPEGFISADNNQYRTTITDPNSVIKDKDGNQLKTATDDMAIMLAEKGLYLEPIKDSAWLWNKNANFQKLVNVGDELIFVADSTETPISPATKDNLAKTKVTAIDYSPNKISLTFDKLPGCFRYSGFISFDVKVVKKPVETSICSSLKITKTDYLDKVLSPQTASKISATTTFAPDNTIPAKTEIRWKSDDKNGLFWRATKAADGTIKYTNITAGINTANPGAFSEVGEEIYYTGYGKVTAELVNIANVPYKTIEPQCTDNFTVVKPVNPPTCSELQINYPVSITEGVISDLMAKATNIDENGKKSDFVGQIKYFVDNAKNGEFFTEPPAEYPYMNQPYHIDKFGYTGKLQGDPKKEGQTGTQTVTIDQKKWTHFVGLKAGEKIHIEAVFDPKTGVDVSKCKADFPIAPAAKCTEIKVNKNLIITEGQVAEFSAIGQDANKKLYNGKITYSVPEEYGTFYTDPNDPEVKAAKKNTSQQSKEYSDKNINLDLTKPIGGEFCANSAQKFKDVLPLMVANTNLISYAIDTALNVMYEINPTYIVNNTIQFAESNYYTIPSYTINQITYPTINQVTDPTKLDMSQDNPFNKIPGTDNVFGAFGSEKLTQADKTKISSLNKQILQVKAGDAQKGSTIVVDPNTKVYFVPKKGSDGKKVISILINCQSEKGCDKSFDIVPLPKEKPIVCEALGLTVSNKTDPKNIQTNVPCLSKKGTYSLNVEAYKDASKIAKLFAIGFWKNNVVKWESTDPDGVFTDIINKTAKPGKSPFLGNYSVDYTGEGKITATLVAIDGKPYTEKTCSTFVEPCTRSCKSIAFTSNGETITPNSSPLAAQKDAKLSLSLVTKDNQDDPLPQSTKLKVQWNTNGTITDKQNSKSTDVGIAKTIQTTLEDLPLTYFGATKNGQITATLVPDPSSTLYAAQCKADVNIVIPSPEEALSCKKTTPTLSKYFGTSQESSLVQNEIYKVGATTTYSKATTEKNTFAVDPHIGTVVVISNDPLVKAAISTLLNNLKLSNALTQTNLEKYKFTLLPEQTVANGESIYVVTYSDTKISLTNALEVKAENFSNPSDCDKTFGLNYIPEKPKEPPKKQEIVCEDLNIKTPKSPWIADSSKKQLFEIDVTTTPKNGKEDLKYVWNVSKGDGKWSNGSTEEKTNSLKNTLKNAGKNTTVEVYALDKNGDKIEKCSDTIKAKTVESPKMSKTVYVTEANPSNTTKDLLNIGSSSKNKNVTYKIEFQANSATAADIRENAMKDDGKIFGDKNGNLSYQGMIINITHRLDKYTILKDGAYSLENEDSKFTDYNFKLLNLEDKHNCYNGTQKAGTEANKVCIGDKDSQIAFKDIINRFKNGEPITFQNLDTDTFIEIKVQMKNNTTINTESCKKLSASDGCGEQFNNTAKFQAQMALTNDIEKGSSSAKVIVICPYVLTRQAGDVFFHDVLDTGIDVSRCSEVKSTPGLVIQPEKVIRRNLLKSGAGDLPAESAFLDVPSHDICRYSNTKGNIEGYNDILSNFSSTICEMRADVAETWKEAYINESIKANVERISRFGENLRTKDTVTNMTDLQNVDNAQSGVFVKEGGTLTIGTGSGGTFEIKSDTNVPAGQTYVVKGGTLHITSDIKYGETDYTNPAKIPSAAFIVIDGNIIIDNNVGQIDAIVMAIDTDGNGDGKITNNATFDENNNTERMLVINGSLIGNVSELFKIRVGAGDPTKDEGAVTIRYDERILLNTPPGLSDLLNITQSLIPG